MAVSGLDYELDLLARLVEIDTSVTGDTRRGYVECSEIIRLEAQRLGLATEVLDGRHVTIDGEPRPNLVVTLEGSTDVDLLFVTHMDVVPADPSKWKTNPFQLVVKGDRAYGRGAADDKSNIVAVLGAMGQLAQEEPEVNMKLLVTCDEEVGGRAGIGYLFQDVGIKGTAGVVVDSAPNYVSIGACGALWGRIVVKGKGGHSGYPEICDNAIYRATALVERLKKYHRVVTRIRSKLRAPPGAPYSKVYGRFTITMIRAWEKENIIPGECEIRFDRRMTPEEDPKEATRHLKDYVMEQAQKLGTDISFHVIAQTAGYYMDMRHPFVRHFTRIASQVAGEKLPIAADLGGNDGVWLAKAGIPVVSFGTIRRDTNFHGVNEFVHLRDIRNLRSTILELGRSPASKFVAK